MSNTLNLYDPLFYAQEGLVVLEKALGMAGRVHRGYDKNPQQKGSRIEISKPSTFTAQDAPSTAQDLTPGNTEIQLNYWREVKFGLTDKELTFTTEKIIQDHIRPAAYALADDIDLKLATLYKDIPWVFDAAGTTEVGDITGPRKILFNNRVPVTDGNIHLMVDGTMEEGFLKLAAFTQNQGAGAEGVATQMRGTLGQKYGFEVFANQNVQTHATAAPADAAGALVGAHAAGVSVVSFDAITASAPLKRGDSFVIAGNTQRYVLTADATADGSGVVTNASISPALVQAYADNAVITVDATDNGKAQNLAFHRNCFALAMAPLSEMGNGLGARIATVVDPITSLALRSRIFYEGNNSKIFVALDVLYGIKTLDPNMGVRVRK